MSSYIQEAYRQLTDKTHRGFAPFNLHAGARFEGFYTKFSLPSGAILIIVICSVPDAPDPARAHNVTTTLVPADTAAPIWQRELFPAAITSSSSATAFTLTATTHAGHELARMHATPSHLEHTLALPDGTTLHAQTTTTQAASTRWSPHTPSPESWLRFLPLPLHWHVHTLSSPARFTLALPSPSPVHPADAAGAALVHAEKNWAAGFPAAHVWLCARRADGASVALAGGRTLGLHAFLAGVRLPALPLAVDFRPPFALALPFLPALPAPFLAFAPDWPARRLSLTLRDFSTKIELTATARDAHFFEFAAPTPAGFASAAMAETMRASAVLRVWRRLGLDLLWALVPFAGARGWTCVATEHFADVGLEFGGAYYTDHVHAHGATGKQKGV